MEDTEINPAEEAILEADEPPPKAKPKPKKPDGRKRPRTEEEKKRLRDQLARGRDGISLLLLQSLWILPVFTVTCRVS